MDYKVINASRFRFDSNYHSAGRVRNFVIYRDKKGNPFKVKLPDGDPGGEHE